MTPSEQPIVVGLDDSPGSTRALGWAIAAARTRGRPLHLISSYMTPTMYGDAVFGMMPIDSESPDDSIGARDVLAAAKTHVEDGVTVTTAAIRGYPADVLLGAAEDASMLVVGSRDRGVAGSIILGSVGNAVAARAECPVVIVRGETDAPPTAPVVVGIDGSDLSESALAFALDQARQVQAPVWVITCPPALGFGRRPNAPAEPWQQESRTDADRHLAEMFGRWQDKFPQVDVVRYSRAEHPIDALTARSDEARLLVVGAHSRTLGPRASTILGSVSQGVLHHARCPVAIIHR